MHGVIPSLIWLLPTHQSLSKSRCRNSWSLCWSTMTWSSGIRMRAS
ncbi:hypothetical protein AZE42_13989 [Rhizopogon vesiculosus]|uniref:Uncharacterized protein n=1 Tax=Rhizopogon vesiculosus TaxID=180088 RepID=A0A1J8QRQ7_9AGAM|nr:hypothetical protein AZE42_13989 [Rhizopogon vesiculosus]